jgi:hypothetical protein
VAANPQAQAQLQAMLRDASVNPMRPRTPRSAGGADPPHAAPQTPPAETGAPRHGGLNARTGFTVAEGQYGVRTQRTTQTTQGLRQPQTTTETTRGRLLTGDNARDANAVPEMPGDDAAAMRRRLTESARATATVVSAGTESGWRGVRGSDQAERPDRTGGSGEWHALAGRAGASAMAGANLRQGRVSAQAGAEVAADVVGGSVEGQWGRAGSLQGALVGDRAGANGGLDIDPRRGTATLGVGAEAFAGAEVSGSVAYQNRYAGVGVEARGQAGAGVAAHAELGLTQGRLRARADLGACLGLGGRVTVNVDVNVGAIYQDSKDAVAGAARAAGGALQDGAHRVGSTLASAWHSFRNPY